MQNLQVEYIDVSKLKPYKNNARKHQKEDVEFIKNSIQQFGMNDPIGVWGKDNLIVEGHGRLLAVKELGFEKVPCIRLDNLTDEQRRAYSIAHNSTAEHSEWDADLLNLEIDELDFDFEDFGLDLEGLEIEEESEEKEVTEDEVPEVDEEAEPTVKIGQVWQLGRHRLMCGDSTKESDVSKLMGGNVADLVFTDPPYGVDYKGINNDNRKGLEQLLEKSFQNIKENSKKGASFYCFHSDRCADIFHNVYRKFCHFSSMIIWVKNSLVLSQTDFQSKHESCMYGWLDNGKHKFYGDRKQESVWIAKKEQVVGHTTPKPIEIISKAITNSSRENEIVLDVFGGSGSTLIAC